MNMVYTAAEAKIIGFARKNNISFVWQPLKFGYRRAYFSFANYEEFSDFENKAKKLKNVSCESGCYSTGEFEGFVYLMGETEKNELGKKLAEEAEAVNQWWIRYHNADPETQRLMRCGKA